MITGEVVFALLSADAGVAALVAKRIYPQIAPQPLTKPYVVYAVVSDEPLNSLQGDTSGLGSARVQIDCYATSYRDVQAVADAVDAVLKARNVYNDSSSLRLSRRDLYESDTKLHRVSADYSIWRST